MVISWPINIPTYVLIDDPAKIDMNSHPQEQTKAPPNKKQGERGEGEEIG